MVSLRFDPDVQGSRSISKEVRTDTTAPLSVDCSKATAVTNQADSNVRLTIKERLALLNGIFPMDQAVVDGTTSPDSCNVQREVPRSL